MAKSSYSGLDSVVGISSGQTVSSVELDRGYNTTQEILKTTVQ